MHAHRRHGRWRAAPLSVRVRAGARVAPSLISSLTSLQSQPQPLSPQPSPGTLRCLGPIQSLKARYGRGYHVSLKLAPDADAAAVLSHLQAAFAGTTLDELEDPLMTVNVPQSARLSHLFSTLQASHELLRVQECSVTQTTLEQVFVRMAKPIIVT